MFNMSPGAARVIRKIQWLVVLAGYILGGWPKANAELAISRIQHNQQVVAAVNVRAGLADLPAGTAWAGLSVDLTKALAAAILQDRTKVKFVLGDRITGPKKLQHGEVDLYLPVEPLAPTKLIGFGLAASYPFFFNLQKIMVRKDSGFTSASQLVHTPIAFQPGYVNEQNDEMANEQHLHDYFDRAGWHLMPFPFQEWEEMESAFTSGHVKAVSAEETELARLRVANRADVGDAVILPEIIAMAPVSAVVQTNDPNWVTLINATISALIRAEELGITSENLDAGKNSKDPEVLYLLGVTPGVGTVVGLDDHWAERVIRAVGNYGQAFERDLGTGFGLSIERSLNQDWRHGGLLYAMPIQ
jgi:general L-amino acid transport system substrate-binding protein